MNEMAPILKSLNELKLANIYYNKNTSFKLTSEILENLNKITLESLQLSYINLNNEKIIELIKSII